MYNIPPSPYLTAEERLELPDVRTLDELIYDFEQHCRKAASNQEKRSEHMAEAFVLIDRIEEGLRDGWHLQLANAAWERKRHRELYPHTHAALRSVAEVVPVSIFLGSQKVLWELRVLADNPPEDRYDCLVWSETMASRVNRTDEWPEKLQYWQLAKMSLEQALEMRP
jgi:hypothetical protein